jgi:hypothetical protein
LTYVTEEQRSRPGWIGRPNVAEILTGNTSIVTGLSLVAGFGFLQRCFATESVNHGGVENEEEPHV